MTQDRNKSIITWQSNNTIVIYRLILFKQILNVRRPSLFKVLSIIASSFHNKVSVVIRKHRLNKLSLYRLSTVLIS